MSFASKITLRPTVEKRRTCSGCGRLGHLISTCENPERFHDMIGIEIEGYWYDLPGKIRLAEAITGSQGVRDGSLREMSSCSGTDEDDPADFEDPDVEDCDDGCDDCPHPIERRNAPQCARNKRDCKACGARSWEFRSRPGSVGESLRQLTQLYPDVTSRAAGMHVHMSFKETSSITMLCSEKFFAYWQTRWEAWGTKNNVQGAFWERLRNENNYCRPAAMADWGRNHAKGADIVTQNSGGRYKAINFASYDTHKTVEFRLLPMFQKGNLAVSAVEQLVDIVETYLQTAELNADVESEKIKFPTSPDAALEMEPVNMEFDVPVHNFAPVLGEIDILGEKPQMGDLGNGTVRLFRHQVANYLANASSDSTEKVNKIADPKRNKVNFKTFNPDPVAKV